MRYLSLNKDLFIKNREKLKNKLNHNSCVIIASASNSNRNGDQNFPFRQNSDFFYLTGIDQEDSFLCLCPNHSNNKYHEILFIKRTDERSIIWNGPKLSKEEAKEISGISTIIFSDEKDAIIHECILKSEFIYLNKNENLHADSNAYLLLNHFNNYYTNNYTLHTFKRLAPLLTELRLKKEKEEIDIINKAISITEKAFYRVLKYTRPGVMEFDIEAEINYCFTTNRANGHAYAPIVASGKNACILHYTENKNQCKDGDLLLMDFGSEYANYASDLSRTIPINGKFNRRQKEVYDAVLKVMEESKKLYVVGKTIKEINHETGLIMEKELIDLKLINYNDVKKQNPNQPLYKKYFMHGTAHFIGLDVHDVGSRDAKLENGMILSCEPGIYIQEEGIGIRLENDILINNNNPIDLMSSIPIYTSDIEYLMNKCKRN